MKRALPQARYEEDFAADFAALKALLTDRSTALLLQLANGTAAAAECETKSLLELGVLGRAPFVRVLTQPDKQTKQLGFAADCLATLVEV